MKYIFLSANPSLPNLSGSIICDMEVIDTFNNATIIEYVLYILEVTLVLIFWREVMNVAQ